MLKFHGIKYAIKSALSPLVGIPANYMAFPGAKAAGFVNHLSKFAAVHFIVALLDNAAE